MNNDTTTTQYAAFAALTFDCPDCGRENVDIMSVITVMGCHLRCCHCGIEWVED
jgi:transcription elongation factor Elf1